MTLESKLEKEIHKEDYFTILRKKFDQAVYDPDSRKEDLDKYKRIEKDIKTYESLGVKIKYYWNIKTRQVYYKLVESPKKELN